MGGFFEKTFLPTMKKLVKAGLSYEWPFTGVVP